MNFPPLPKILKPTLLVLFSAAAGYIIGQNEVNLSWRQYRPEIVIKSKEAPGSLNTADFTLFWDVWERTVRNYYDKKAIDAEKMRDGAISGMLQSLGDPYTVFLEPAQNQAAKQELKGEFEGIGAQLGLKDKKIVVIAPLANTPAEKAGIKAGDLIVKIDGKETVGLNLPEAVAKIRGQKGTSVTLTILHDKEKEPVDISITRDTIMVKSVEGEIKKLKVESGELKIFEQEEVCDGCSKIAYIRLSQFGDNTSKEWLNIVLEIKGQIDQDSSIKGLVLDLRNNPGGYLNGAVFIASEFIDQGVVVMQEKEGQRSSLSVDRKGLLTKIPMVVLINKGSASASEIVAGALRDHGRARLVGEASFGKGTVQEALDLPQNAGLHLTTAKWLTPNGIWINEKGLTPDIAIETDKEDQARDVQLEKAVEELVL